MWSKRPALCTLAASPVCWQVALFTTLTTLWRRGPLKTRRPPAFVNPAAQLLHTARLRYAASGSPRTMLDPRHTPLVAMAMRHYPLCSWPLLPSTDRRIAAPRSPTPLERPVPSARAPTLRMAAASCDSTAAGGVCWKSWYDRMTWVVTGTMCWSAGRGRGARGEGNRQGLAVVGSGTSVG